MQSDHAITTCVSKATFRQTCAGLRFTMSGKVSGLPHRSKRALFTQKKNLDRIIVLRNPPGVTTGQWVAQSRVPG